MHEMLQGRRFHDHLARDRGITPSTRIPGRPVFHLDVGISHQSHGVVGNKVYRRQLKTR